ncbi:MAG: glycosyltransferase family 61 protein [Opitutaceae bacterium]
MFDSKWQLVPSYGRSFGKEPGRQEFLKYRSKYIHATSNELEWGHFCLKPSDINYYHFIYDSLPYVLLHREFAHSNVIILRTKHSEGLIAALGLEGIVYPIERYDNVRVADCGLFDPPAYSGRPHPVLLKRLRDAIAGVVHKDSKSPKRIYLSRADSGKRRVVNEDAVRTLLDQYGFTTVLMSEHTIMEQLQLIQNADVIVAGHGAALANIIAARSNKTVLIEMFPSSYINNCYAYIATMIGVHYLSLCFESRDGVDDDYCVEIGPLENLLESMT